LSGVEPAVVRPDALAAEDLTGFGSVIACNLDRWPAARLEDLRRFVARGGGLAVFLGDRVAPRAWEETLYEQGAGLLPCALGARQEAPREEDEPTVAPPEEEHPLTAVFSEGNPFLRGLR